MGAIHTPGVLSPTGLQSWLYCGYRFKCEHIDEIEQPLSWAKEFGTIGHAILEYDGDPFASFSDLGFSHFFDQTYYSMVEDFRNQGLVVDDSVVTKGFSELAEMIFNFQNWVRDERMEYVQRELRFEFEYHGHKMEGTTDALVRFPSTPEGMVEMIDYKFGSRIPDDRALNRNIQQGLYFYAATEAGYKIHQNAWIQMRHFEKYKKKGKTANVGDLKGKGLYPIKITMDDMPALLELVHPILQSIDNQIFPANAYPGDACRSCHVSNICPQFAIGRRIEESDVLI